MLACLAPKSWAPPQPVTERKGLKCILDPRPHPHPLVTVEQKRPQISLLGRGDLNRGETIFYQQLQLQHCIPSIVLLPPWFGRADLRRVTDLAIDSQLFHPVASIPTRTGPGREA